MSVCGGRPPSGINELLSRCRTAATLLALLVMLCGALSRPVRARAQDAAVPDVSVSIDRSRVTIGDPIALTVVVKHATSVQIQTTTIDDQLGDFEPLGSDPPDDHAVGGGMELRLHYKIATYQTGAVQVPALTFAYVAADGSLQKVSSKGPLDVTVQSVLPAGSDPSDIRPLKPQASLPGPPSNSVLLVFGLAGAAVLAAALGLLAYQFLRRRRKAPARAEPAYAADARAELDRIMALNLLGKGELIEHYRKLAVVIRRYLTERYGFPAVALTTGELQRQMEARGIARWPARLVTGLLNECDAVTYARYVPAPARCEADNAMAYEILDATDEQAPIAFRAG